jgi:hypothetical protein
MHFGILPLFACSESAAPASSGWSPEALIPVGIWLAVLVAMLLIRPLRKGTLFVAYGLVTILVVSFLPAVDEAREAARQTSCTCNLAQIGLALQTYADIYKTFPPAYVTDEKGNRMHSWRVLVLPFMEQKPLYDQYDFSEPWNGPDNRLLAEQMPPLFRCPSDNLSAPGETSYAAIDGPGTLLSEDRGSLFSDVTDGTSQTIAVAEAAGSGIHWMEPRDVPFSALRGGIMGKSKPGIASAHRDTCRIVFGDGHSSTLKTTTSVKILQALATRAGGERILDDY